MRRFATLLLLLLVGFGLMAGPHPCHALRAPKADAIPACHAQRVAASTAQPVLSAARHDCCRDDAQSRLCESTCQMAAAFTATISLPAASSVSSAQQPLVGRAPLPLANPIDHVPLV